MTSWKMTRFIAVIALVGGLTAACQTSAPEAAAPDYAAELRPALEMALDAWNTQDYAKLDTAVTEDFKRVAPNFSANSRAEMAEGMRGMHARYADFKVVCNETSFSKDLGFCQWTATGIASAADGSKVPVSIDGASMFRFAGNKLSEEWVYFDTALLGLAAATQANAGSSSGRQQRAYTVTCANSSVGVFRKLKDRPQRGRSFFTLRCGLTPSGSRRPAVPDLRAFTPSRTDPAATLPPQTGSPGQPDPP